MKRESTSSGAAAHHEEPPTSLTVERVQRLLGARYTIVRLLGAGGAGVVFLAQEAGSRQPLALKVLRPELSADIAAERFLREVDIGQRLRHPNILPILDSGAADGELYCTMPFVDGESLRDRIAREKQLSIADTLRTARAVANALDFAHHHGVIHRDIKPANILLDAGRVFVADFGIARAMDAAATTRLTATGIAVGTAAYMSPEQGTGERSITGQSDIYALGCTVYEMLAGEPPFTGATPLAVIARHCQEPPRSLQVVRPTVPIGVQRAVEKALAKIPADRFASAGEFLDALEAGARADAGAGVAPEPRPVPRPRHAALARGVAVAAVLTAALAGGAWWRVAHAPAPPVVRFTVDPPPGMRVNSTWIALSPDGQSLAFTANARNDPRLVLRRLDRTTPVVFPRVLRPSVLAFSPNGRHLATMDSGPVVIPFGADDAEAEPLRLVTLPGFGSLGWTHRSDIMYFHADAFWRISAGGGAPRQIAAMDTSVDRMWRRLTMMPDGRTIAFTVVPRGGSPEQPELALMSVDGGPYTLPGLTGGIPIGYVDGALIFSRASPVAGRGRLMAVRLDLKRGRLAGEPVTVVEPVDNHPTTGAAAAVSNNGTLAYTVTTTRRTFEIRADDGRVLASLSDTAEYNNPVWSPDGSRVAVSFTSGGRPNVSVFDPETGLLTRVTRSGGGSHAWTPDGARLGFIDERERAMWVAADGSAEPEPIPGVGSERMWGVGFSPDGRFVLIQTAMTPTEPTPRLFAIPLDGGSPIPLLTGIPQAGLPAVSPDGRWIAYTSGENGPPQVYVRPFPTGAGRVQISRNGGTSPRWSPDGRQLSYRWNRVVRIADLDVSGPLPQATKTDSISLERPGEPRIVALEFHPDGRRTVVTRDVGSETKLFVVTNWVTELRAKLAAR